MVMTISCRATKRHRLPGTEGVARYGTSSAKSRRVLGRLGELVTVPLPLQTYGQLRPLSAAKWNLIFVALQRVSSSFGILIPDLSYYAY